MECPGTAREGEVGLRELPGQGLPEPGVSRSVSACLLGTQLSALRGFPGFHKEMRRHASPQPDSTSFPSSSAHAFGSQWILSYKAPTFHPSPPRRRREGRRRVPRPRKARVCSTLKKKGPPTSVPCAGGPGEGQAHFHVPELPANRPAGGREKQTPAPRGNSPLCCLLFQVLLQKNARGRKGQDGELSVTAHGSKTWQEGAKLQN